MKMIDLDQISVRELNQLMHDQSKCLTESLWQIDNPKGQHNIACGLDADLSVTIEGHVGYFCAGMNQHAKVFVNGNVGQGVAENMMSGEVRVAGDASQSAGATAHGGLLVIEGSASSRCGISLKGADIVVKGDIGPMSCFMGQAGNLVVCGDAGEALGDSVYEVKIFIKGDVKSLGADCIEKEMRAEHLILLKKLLDRAGIEEDPSSFKRYGSARKLYNFEVDNVSAY